MSALVGDSSMLHVKTKLKDDYRDRETTAKATESALSSEESNGIGSRPLVSPQVPLTSVPPPRKSNQPTFPVTHVTESRAFQTRVPIIIGEATYRGAIPVDGIITGQVGNHGGALSIRQRSRRFSGTEPELSGEICFKDMLRVNGHIAGTIQSAKGTLIVDVSAKIDADVEVAVAVINGIVNGDIVAHQRVEVGPTAKIYGNIWTRSLAIQRGAIFEGVCQMLEV
jgi:cytoskeletal protein CcmA (bactofilin family)